ncbi:hypothetical protein CLU79DRAFT_832959 [Phycomyces nitens]|nr:hypothetical protein CLU79DRAFT_832959 [Phycomyces nitens]
MRIEKSKDDNIYMKEANVKRDYMRYTVQDKQQRSSWEFTFELLRDGSDRIMCALIVFLRAVKM